MTIIINNIPNFSTKINNNIQNNEKNNPNKRLYSNTATPLSFYSSNAIPYPAHEKISFKGNFFSNRLLHINGVKLSQINIPNFSIVEIEKCYRGGQPDKNNLKQLASMGVKTIVNLRDFATNQLPRNEQKIFNTENAHIKFPKEIGKMAVRLKKTGQFWHLEHLKEKITAEKLGMKYVNIPMSTKIPSDKREMTNFLETVSDKNSMPVYVHCLHGRDRTGVMAALYRIKKQGWSYDKAVNEWESKDYKVISGYLNLKEHLRDFLFPPKAGEAV